MIERYCITWHWQVDGRRTAIDHINDFTIRAETGTGWSRTEKLRRVIARYYLGNEAGWNRVMLVRVRRVG